MLRLYCDKCTLTSKYLFRNDFPFLQSLRKCYSSKENNDRKHDVQVYYGNLTPQIRAVKIFSLSSSIMGLGAQPVLYQHASDLGAPITVALFGFIGFFTFVTPFLLHSITKKYVTHIYFNSGSELYSATVLDFFLREKRVTFNKDDVVVPDIPGMFTSFQVKGLPLFVDPRLFGEPLHYAKIMGYDKPIDFKLKDSSDKPSTEGKKKAE